MYICAWYYSSYNNTVVHHCFHTPTNRILEIRFPGGPFWKIYSILWARAVMCMGGSRTLLSTHVNCLSAGQYYTSPFPHIKTAFYTYHYKFGANCTTLSSFFCFYKAIHCLPSITP